MTDKLFSIIIRKDVKGDISGQDILDTGADLLIIQDKNKAVGVNPHLGSSLIQARVGDITVVRATDKFSFPESTSVAYGLSSPFLADGIKTNNSPGFIEIGDVDISFDDNTRTLIVEAVNADYKAVVNNGISYTKTYDSVQISDTEGLHYVYFDNSGTLVSLLNPNRSTQYDILNETLPVSFVYWDKVDQKAIFATDVLKKINMPISTWVKNVFDKQIYPLDGLNVLDDPSSTADGSINSDSQFGISSGALLFADRKFPTSLKNAGDSWEVLYLENGKLRSKVKPQYAFLQDTDFATTTTSRLVYNNGGTPVVVDSGKYVWYFVGINNNINQNSRLLSFMGQSQYINKSEAEASIESERKKVEESFSIRQEFALTHAVLFETKNNFTNTVKSRVISISILGSSDGGSSSASSIPTELVSGGFTDLHHHINPRKIVSSNYTILTTDGDIFASNSAVITLPTVVGEIKQYTIVNTDGTLIKIIPTNGTIIGETEQFLKDKYNAVTFFTDGTNWYIK